MADNNILEATVKLSIDQSSVNKSINEASKKLETGLKKADGSLSKQLSSQISRDVQKLGNAFEKAAKGLSRILEKGLKSGAALGTGALLAFLKSGTPEALKFSDSLDRLKMSFAKVGQTLATKIKFGGATGQEWLDRLVTKIENLNVSQIEKIVGYFKAAAGVWASIKIGEGLALLAKITSGAVDLSKALASKFTTPTQVPNISAPGSIVGNVTPFSEKPNNSQIFKERFQSDKINNRLYAARANLQNESSKVSAFDAIFATSKNVKQQDKSPQLIAAEKEYQSAVEQKAKLENRITNYKKEQVANEKRIAVETDRIAKEVEVQNKRAAKFDKGMKYAAGAGAVLYGANKGINAGGTRGENVSTGFGFAGAGALGAALGGPIGASIGLALAEGADLLSKSISGPLMDWWYKVKGDQSLGKNESPSTLGKMDQATYYDNLQRMAKGLKPILPKDIENAFKNSTGAIKATETFGKQTNALSNNFVGGDIPLEERKKLIPDAMKNMNATDSSIKELEAIPIQTDTIKKQIAELQKAKQELKNFIDESINLGRSQKDSAKAFEEAKADADKRISKKQEQNEKLTKKEDDQLMGKDKKPTGGSISSGSIEALPDMLSQAINDQLNSREEDIFELNKRQLEIDEDRKQREEELQDMIIQKNKETKDYEEKTSRLMETFTEALLQLTGGSSTVVNA